MWGVDFVSDEPFVYAVFGVQYQGDSPSDTRAALINTFNGLIQPAATYIDNITEDGQGSLGQWRTRIWLSYWTSAGEYSNWWQSPEVSQFWESLPLDAGIYREILTVSPRRAQFGTNKETKSGLANVGGLAPNADKSMYWGCYRDRYKDATPENRLNSPLESTPTRNEQLQRGQVRLGRTLMTRFPDNLCFVIEGQDHSRISNHEKEHWFAKFDKSVTTWMEDLREAGSEAGILDARFCYSDVSGQYRNDTFAALNYKRKVQIFWFLDHRHMEKIGRSNKGHRSLRSNFIESYCPAGPMGSIGELLLWVESSILKADEIQCEYVGCLEGTGFTAYETHPAFRGK